jgi:hypothetical protein
MFNVTSRQLIQAALVAAIGFVGAGIVSAEERGPRNASPELRRLLAWLPADTETLVAAQSFSVPPFSDKDVNKSHDAMPLFALGDFFNFDYGRNLEPFVGRKILIALNGMRRSQPVGAFGDFYAEGCSVVVFERDLGHAAVAWTDALRKSARKIRKIAGREVFCCAPPKNKARLQSSVYFVRLAPDTILCATHDEYLQQLLGRIDTPPRDRAFPDSLRLWATVDRSAPVWMIRQIPGNSLRLIEGVSWSWANDQARVVYLPRGSSAGEALERARKRWEAHPPDDGPDGPRLADSLRKAVHFELGNEGRVTVSFKIEGHDDPVRFLLFFGLFWLQTEDGSVGSQ